MTDPNELDAPATRIRGDVLADAIWTIFRRRTLAASLELELPEFRDLPADQLRRAIADGDEIAAEYYRINRPGYRPVR